MDGWMEDGEGWSAPGVLFNQDFGAVSAYQLSFVRLPLFSFLTCALFPYRLQGLGCLHGASTGGRPSLFKLRSIMARPMEDAPRFSNREVAQLLARNRRLSRKAPNVSSSRVWVF